MTLLMSSCTRTARAIADGERGSSLCWLVDDPSPLLCRQTGAGENRREEEGGGGGEGEIKMRSEIKKHTQIKLLKHPNLHTPVPLLWCF